MKRNHLVEKSLAIGIILLFVGTCIIPAIAQYTEKPRPTFRGDWLYVGGSGSGNYTRIQDAIDNASDGDTIYIYSGNYYEHQIIINKKINIIGEKKETTVIHGEGMNEGISFSSDFINVSCISITNFSDYALGLWYAHYVTISDVIITSNEFIGITLNYAMNAVIDNCTIENNMYGLWANYCDNSLYINNHFSFNQDCDIRNTRGPGTIIVNNIFENNTLAIFIDDSGTTGISIYHNFFTYNNCMDDGQNSWDNGYPSGGNYWEDYTGTDNYHGPNQNLSGSDGIGDTPYNISGGSNQDLYSFMEPNGWANEPPISPNIYGPDNGITGEAYFFNTDTITDPDGDSLFCFWDWGDGNSTGWLGPYPSGVNISAAHVWFYRGVYEIRAKLKDSYGSESNWSEPHTITINESEPPIKPIIDGPSWGLKNINYTFCFTWADSDADDFYCKWDWGDGNITEWLGPYSASQTICANHSWSQKGTYEIYVKLKDIHGVEINSDPHLFTVYELKKVFVFGRYTNLTEEGGYSTIEAVKLRVLLFKPFQFLHYNDGEIVTFLKDTLKGLVLPRFIIGIVDVIT